MAVFFCDYCGKENSREPSMIKKWDHNFCDRDCYHGYLRNVEVLQKGKRDMTYFELKEKNKIKLQIKGN